MSLFLLSIHSHASLAHWPLFLYVISYIHIHTYIYSRQWSTHSKAQGGIDISGGLSAHLSELMQKMVMSSSSTAHGRTSTSPASFLNNGGLAHLAAVSASSFRGLDPNLSQADLTMISKTSTCHQLPKHIQQLNAGAARFVGFIFQGGRYVHIVNKLFASDFFTGEELLHAYHQTKALPSILWST